MGPSPRVGLIMGSQSDWSTLRHAAAVLDELAIAHEDRIVSAHRTPERLVEYATTARARGLQVIIAGAGGAAHLPGMVAAMTTLPVLGVPVESRALHGLDSLLSIVQMPGGVPVGTLAIGRAGAINAALLAASILGLQDDAVAAALDAWRAARTAGVAETPADHGEGSE
jgi:5-(carboxyamino)imidazole ribonucleotide mutase